MFLEKEVTVSKQGGMSINIPKQMCKSLDINAGDKLSLIMDGDTHIITMSKIEGTKIFKIQKSVYEDMAECLVYDRTHEHIFPLPYTDEIMDLFENEYKIYVEGFIDTNKKFNIIRKVEQQAW